MDGLGRFKAVHARHVDVQQDHGKVVHQHLAQRFLARACRQHLVRFLLRPLGQQTGQRKQAVGVVIDDQDFGFV